MGKQNGKPLRRSNGRYLKGKAPGPGRPKGSPNKSTIDSRKLRDAILASWTRNNCDKKLDALCKRDFGFYLKVVVSLLPKNLDVDVSGSVEQSMTIHPVAIAFIERVRKFAGKDVIGPTDVLDLMDADRAKRFGNPN